MRTGITSLGFAAMLACSGVARAAMFTVDSTSDSVDNNTADVVCADSGGKCTLRAALQQANAQAGADEIVVPAGTYNLSLGTLPISSAITITGAGAADTVIDAGLAFTVLNVSPGASGPVNIGDVTIRNGSAPADAGGIFLTNNSTLTLTHVVVSGNRAITGAAQGGGIYVGGGSTLNLNESTVSDNTCKNGGGGVRIVTAGTANIDRSTISGNSATGFGSGGGGIETQGTLVLNNSTLSGNTTPFGSGAAIAVESSSVTTIANSTVADNGGPEQIQRSGLATISLGATAVAQPRGSTINCSGTIVSLGDNLDSGTTCAFGVGSISGAGASVLGPLADNGGSTRTHRLLPGSPATDAVVSGCPPPASDQRLVARPQGAACDIGAYESDTLFEDGFE